MSWWVPLAFVAAGLCGRGHRAEPHGGPAALRARPPKPPTGHGHGAPRKSRYRQDNDLVWNPGAFVTAAASSAPSSSSAS